MKKIEELHFESQKIRLMRLGRAWWVFCADAAPRINSGLSQEILYASAPEGERRIVRVGSGFFVYLVSARHLLTRMHEDEATDHDRFRAWIRAWKVVSEFASGVDED